MHTYSRTISNQTASPEQEGKDLFLRCMPRPNGEEPGHDIGVVIVYEKLIETAIDSIACICTILAPPSVRRKKLTSRVPIQIVNMIIITPDL